MTKTKPTKRKKGRNVSADEKKKGHALETTSTAPDSVHASNSML
jgi:hypothetical protein